MMPPDEATAGALSRSCWSIAIPRLSLPLYRADDGDDIVAEWQSWARVLGLPLLVAEADGVLREPFDRIGAVRVAAPAAAPAPMRGIDAAGGRRS